MNSLESGGAGHKFADIKITRRVQLDNNGMALLDQLDNRWFLFLHGRCNRLGLRLLLG
ncbi:hypothetical protein D3C84_1233380 [compost metagenome]